MSSVLTRAARAGTAGTPAAAAATTTTSVAAAQGHSRGCAFAGMRLSGAQWLPSSFHQSPSFASAVLSDDGNLGADQQRRAFSSSSSLPRAKKAQRLQASRRRRAKQRVTPPASVPSGGRQRAPAGAQQRDQDQQEREHEEARSPSREVAVGRSASGQPSASGETSPQQASVLDRSAVIVTREIEMFNVFLGFEQRNRYTLRDPNGNIVGYVEEEGEGLGKVIARQMLRTRRPLRASVLSPTGELLYTIYRPFYFIQR